MINLSQEEIIAIYLSLKIAFFAFQLLIMKTMYNLIYLILELLSFVDNTYLSNFVNTFGVTYVISVSLA